MRAVRLSFWRSSDAKARATTHQRRANDKVVTHMLTGPSCGKSPRSRAMTSWSTDERATRTEPPTSIVWSAPDLTRAATLRGVESEEPGNLVECEQQRRGGRDCGAFRIMLSDDGLLLK